MDNLVLIGMPGCGKSTVGVFLARAIGWTFLDSDRLIERETGKRLSTVAEEAGTEAFRDIEGAVNAALNPHRSVIATGGSVIYREEAMRHLRDIGTVVYLRFTCDSIESRLGDLAARGVSMRAGQTLRELYDERCPLYERYAHLTVDCDGLRPGEIVALVRARTGLTEGVPLQ